MQTQKDTRDVARSRILIEELIADHHLAAQFFDELAESLSDPDKRQKFAVNATNCMHRDGKLLVEFMGSVARMTAHTRLEEIFLPARERFPVGST